MPAREGIPEKFTTRQGEIFTSKFSSHIFIYPLCQTFKHIFTSPASAKEVSVLQDEEAIENDVNQLNTRRAPKRKKPARKPVAATLRMSKVTPRALAYAATQVGSICSV
jgi:hypothetical protein